MVTLCQKGLVRSSPQRALANRLPIQTYEDLVELAKICVGQARETKSRKVAAELRRMAKDYQKRAAELSNGKLLDLRD
jgi:hypothetical protein